jgi:hypothetical protein
MLALFLLASVGARKLPQDPLSTLQLLGAEMAEQAFVNGTDCGIADAQIESDLPHMST